MISLISKNLKFLKTFESIRTQSKAYKFRLSPTCKNPDILAKALGDFKQNKGKILENIIKLYLEKNLNCKNEYFPRNYEFLSQKPKRDLISKSNNRHLLFFPASNYPVIDFFMYDKELLELNLYQISCAKRKFQKIQYTLSRLSKIENDIIEFDLGYSKKSLQIFFIFDENISFDKLENYVKSYKLNTVGDNLDITYKNVKFISVDQIANELSCNCLKNFVKLEQKI
ncbi:unnamed protein product [Brachionus calyciflorus]|uniref:Uncharacterized protein n=1 Tax=Brachionus calyciflorus TaxID=104777 RepID=A0A813M2J7_9BILA|nr:unnamed protein product [Brachionus calyciflorus]